MFDEDLPKPKTNEFPRNLESLSVADLDEYITELREEIARVEDDKAKKQASQDAAVAIFKS